MSSEREKRYFKALGMRFEGQPGAIEAMLCEQVQRVMAVADAELAKAWLEGHAAGRDYAGDGWNSDCHDPADDNPYATERP